MHFPNSFSFSTLRRCYVSALALAAILTLAACGTTDTGGSTPRAGGKALVCKSGDEMVSSSQQCLQDDAACYQISNGKWCTGERGNTCPAGSVAIAAGTVCPRGARCINYGESLTCAIQTR